MVAVVVAEHHHGPSNGMASAGGGPAEPAQLMVEGQLMRLLAQAHSIPPTPLLPVCVCV